MGLGDPGCDRADPGLGDKFHADLRIGVDLFQVEDQLGEILDRIDIVMRRRRYKRYPRRGMAQPGDNLRHLYAGQLSALAGLGALGDLDLYFPAVVQIFGRYAEPARCDLFDGAGRIVAVRARLVARRILAAFARIGFRADPVHRDRKRFVRFRAECAERYAGRHETLADFGDRFHFLDRYRVALGAEFHQVAQAYRRRLAHGLGVFFVGRIGIRGDGFLQRMNLRALEAVGLAALPIAVQPADRQCRDVLVESADMQLAHLALKSGKPDSGNARRHTREVARNQPPAQPDRFEHIGAAIARNDRDTHLGHDLEQALVDRFAVTPDTVEQRHVAEQPPAMAVDDGFLRQIGVHRRRPDADQNGEIMGVQAFGAADVDRCVGSQRFIDEMRMNRAGRQDHRHRRAARTAVLVRQNKMRRAAAHGVLRHALKLVDRPAQRVFALFGPERAVEHHRGIAEIVAHCRKAGIGQDRAVELQQPCLAFVLVENIAEIAEPGLEAHHAVFAQGIDRRARRAACRRPLSRRLPWRPRPSAAGAVRALRAYSLRRPDGAATPCRCIPPLPLPPAG